MAIKDDILNLMQIQENLFKTEGNYVQALPTPAEMPVKDSVSTFSELLKPDDVEAVIAFTPTAKDYQFMVDVWQSNKDKGFVVTAKRDLGDDITETIYSMRTEV